MAGIQIKLNVSVAGDFPVLKADEIMSSGSLFLMDNNYYPPGGLAHGATFKNMAWEEAADIINPSLPESALMPSLTIGAGGFASPSGLLELSGKKGIHALISQVNHTNRNQFARINLPSDIVSYLIANPTHNYYVSTWKKRTRIRVSGVQYAYSALNFADTSNFLAFEDAAGSGFFGSGGYANIGPTVLGDVFKNKNITTKTGTTDSSSPAGNYVFASGGGANAFTVDSLVLNKLESSILYRYYIEDLTVSGRSYSEVSALDQAMFAAAFASGGRLNGDTYTSPSSLP